MVEVVDFGAGLDEEFVMSQFQPGESGNPNGRPKGSSGGRVQALAALDVMLAKKKNQRALVKALESEFLGDPVRFFKSIIMPLLPREAKLSLDHDGVIRWQSLLVQGDGVESEQLTVESGKREAVDSGALTVESGQNRTASGNRNV